MQTGFNQISATLDSEHPWFEDLCSLVGLFRTVFSPSFQDSLFYRFVGNLRLANHQRSRLHFYMVTHCCFGATVSRVGCLPFWAGYACFALGRAAQGNPGRPGATLSFSFATCSISSLNKHWDNIQQIQAGGVPNDQLYNWVQPWSNVFISARLRKQF